MTKLNNVVDYLNQHLLDCETGMDEIFVNVRGFNDSVEVVDVIGVIEEKGRIYIGLEVEYNEYCYLINISFIDVWEYVYKDEMIEIQDVLSNLISEQLKADLGLKDNILEDIKQWTKEETNGDQQEEKSLLNDLIIYGAENIAPNHLMYHDDIQLYYKEHKKEINKIIKEITGYTIDNAINDLSAFETVINNIGGLDSELEFENSHELENSQLCWFVWLVFEHVAYEYLETLESK